MKDINLRNWREEKRTKDGRQYKEINVLILVLLVLAVVLTNLVATTVVGKQRKINDYLKSEQVVLNQNLTKIGELEKKIKEINSRMEIINSLQGDRSNIIIIFDEIAKKTPKEVKLKKLKRENEFLKIEGISVSQLNISTYLTNLNNSDSFLSPRLEQVVADKKVDGFERSRFFIKTEIDNKNPHVENGER